MGSSANGEKKSRIPSIHSHQRRSGVLKSWVKRALGMMTSAAAWGWAVAAVWAWAGVVAVVWAWGARG